MQLSENTFREAVNILNLCINNGFNEDEIKICFDYLSLAYSKLKKTGQIEFPYLGIITKQSILPNDQRFTKGYYLKPFELTTSQNGLDVRGIVSQVIDKPTEETLLIIKSMFLIAANQLDTEGMVYFAGLTTFYKNGKTGKVSLFNNRTNKMEINGYPVKTPKMFVPKIYNSILVRSGYIKVNITTVKTSKIIIAPDHGQFKYELPKLSD